MRHALFVLILLGLLSVSGCTSTSAPTAKQVNPKAMAESHYSMALAFLEQSNASRALGELLKARELDPDNADIVATMAQAYEMKKAFSLAENHYRQAIEMKPGDPYYHHNLAAMFIRMERYEEAIPEFQKAADNLFFPQTEVALAGIGYAYQQQQKYDQAIVYYQRALEHAPNYALGWLRLGECTFAVGNTDEAIVHLQKAIGLAPVFPMAHFRLGLAYLDKKDQLQARAAFEKTVEQAPKSDAAAQARHFLKLLE